MHLTDTARQSRTWEQLSNRGDNLRGSVTRRQISATHSSSARDGGCRIFAVYAPSTLPMMGSDAVDSDSASGAMYFRLRLRPCSTTRSSVRHPLDQGADRVPLVLTPCNRVMRIRAELMYLVAQDARHNCQPQHRQNVRAVEIANYGLCAQRCKLRLLQCHAPQRDGQSRDACTVVIVEVTE